MTCANCRHLKRCPHEVRCGLTGLRVELGSAGRYFWELSGAAAEKDAK